IRRARDRRLADLDVERGYDAVDRRVHARLAQPVLGLLELRTGLRELLDVRLEVHLGEPELVGQEIEAVLIDQAALIERLLALPLLSQILEPQPLTLDRDFLEPNLGLI